MQRFTAHWLQRTEFEVSISLSQPSGGVRRNEYEHRTHLKKAPRTSDLWRIGILEYWSIGKKPNTPSRHYSSTPANDAVNSFP
jgi:hypothetical protein